MKYIITENKLEKVFQKGFKNRNGWKQLADYVVDAHVSGITDEQKEDLSVGVAVGMSMGEILSKKHHILTGVAIGMLGSGLAILLIDKQKSKEFEDIYNESKED